ncbi:hypothetical protein AB0J74_28170 [Asanoa sp. NPDC049573]|uniref:hypothetical protein n=1 Tax=Asanoa sp. NPDC049573 TaxID=3155396 RepID=UPI00342C2163
MIKLRVAAVVLLVASLAGCSTGDPATSAVTPAASPADPPAALAQKINVVLTAQSAALTEGDEAGFLAPAKGNAEVEATLKRRFAGLRAMRVGEVHQQVSFGPEPSGTPGRWNAQIRFDYCLGGTGCGVDGPQLLSSWEETPEGVRLVDLDPSSYGPRPWEVDDLAVQVGERAIVAAPKSHAADLRGLLPIADRAAEVADTFALGGNKPFRYVVYLAPKEQWKTWFSNNIREDRYAGYALISREEGTDLVLNLADLSREDADSLLRHEMAHLATITHAPRSDTDGSAWWLAEGIAEVAGEQGQGSDADDYRGTDVRAFLRATPSYKGNLATVGPAQNDTASQTSARYGLGYYASRCIDEKYGRKKLLALADALLRNDKEASAVSPGILGTKWKTVESNCFAYTRRAVGL